MTSVLEWEKTPFGATRKKAPKKNVYQLYGEKKTSGGGNFRKTRKPFFFSGGKNVFTPVFLRGFFKNRGYPRFLPGGKKKKGGSPPVKKTVFFPPVKKNGGGVPGGGF